MSADKSSKTCLPFFIALRPKFCKRLRAFSISRNGDDEMYFTDTSTLNSIEAIMKKLPYGTQKGGGRFRRLYQYTKKDCDCRLCLYYRKKNGCALTHCPMLDIRLGCGAATIGDAVKAVFKDTHNTAFQKRLSQIYYRKDDAKMIFQNNRHKQIFEAEPDVLLCASWFKRFPEEVVVKASLKPGLLDFLKRDFLGHSTVMIRIGNKKEFLYKQEYEVCDDIELYSRLIMKGRFYVIPEALVNYRFEGKGISIKKSNKVCECAKKIKNQQMEFLTSDKKHHH